jgi:cell division septation protein DedD
LLFRRGPKDIEKSNGFDTMAKTNKVPENISLWDHCKVKGAEAKFGNLADDGYVSTSSDFGVCMKWVTDYIEDPAGSTIYKIASDRNLISCHDTLGKCTYTCLLWSYTTTGRLLTVMIPDNPLPDEQEYAAIGGIPWAQVMGWYTQFTVRGGTIQDAVYTANPKFAKARYNKIPDGGDKSNVQDTYRLAGWPAKDKRWEEAPWKGVRDPVCGKSDKPAKGGKKKNGRRDIDDNEDIEDSEVNEDLQLVARDDEDMQLETRDSEDMQLVARKSKKSSKKSSKKPAKTPTTKKPTTKKPTTKKPTTKKPTTKKPTTKKPAAKCTAAMKKAGKCGTTCTAAEKKKNGGKCPTKDTCTAAEKKANGGTCPPKACGLRKTNRQLAEEYLKLYKAGQLGKGKKSGKAGKKTGKAGKKTGA